MQEDVEELQKQKENENLKNMLLKKDEETDFLMEKIKHMEKEKEENLFQQSDFPFQG